MEVGNFITYKKMLMAVVAINPETNKLSALCYKNHKLATIDMSDKGIKIVKEEGCPRLIRGVYDLMKQYSTLEATL